MDIDTHQPDQLDCYDYSHPTSPNIDTLTNELAVRYLESAAGKGPVQPWFY